MPLPAPVKRKSLHTRRIECNGYEREDGLWDIEARMRDTKHYAFTNKFRGEMEPGTPIHDMWIRLTVDDKMVVQDIVAVTDDSPFEPCPSIVGNYKAMIGSRIGVGWRRAIKEKLGGVCGCTHLTELLGPMATVAYQTMMPELIKRKLAAMKAAGKKPDRPPGIINSCHAWASDSPVVKDEIPDFYTGE